MRKFVHVGFAFAGVPKILDLEPVFNGMGDEWIRYSSTNWILFTDKEPQAIYWLLHSYIDAQDNVFIAPFTADTVFGRLPPWCWQWLQQRNAQITYVSPGPVNRLLPPFKR